MRTLFLVLVLANLALFAWWRYLSPADSGLDRLPLARQIEPDKLKIVPPAELTRAPAKKAAPPAAAPASQAATPGAQSCLEWGSFTLADAPRMEKALEPLGLGERLAQRRTEETAGWWVFIPSQGSRQAALKKVVELKALGVEEFFVLAEDSQFRWALSLGVFRNEDAAQARLAALRNQGVRTARVGPRELVVPKVWLQVKSVDAATEARLKEIAGTIDGSELRGCPPG
ncbi:MAG TPA: SPOR domain-containing protein [Burkholderiales bacterium]|nr:SPOR domain-containing protein [Burkholderiales bacterium]